MQSNEGIGEERSTAPASWLLPMCAVDVCTRVFQNFIFFDLKTSILFSDAGVDAAYKFSIIFYCDFIFMFHSARYRVYLRFLLSKKTALDRLIKLASSAAKYTISTCISVESAAKTKSFEKNTF